ncbi:MAG TPA: LD-carboxypeptidase [Brumimicrobium sp.]|nr:LD-carboxypeptidase [Brumimicrobium sp.]
MLPKNLQKDDTIAILAPAKRIEREFVDFAVKVIEEQGFKAIISSHCLDENNYFSGTIEERKKDFQWALDNENVAAILCARGGYGCVQILEGLNWDKFVKHPKWIIGFSDVTVFHQKIAALGLASLHASMPLNFKDNSEESLATLFKSIQGEEINHHWKSSVENKEGVAEGEIIGGNLAVLCGLIGTRHQPDFTDKILFIEEVGEALYAIDRNLYQLKMAGIFDQISGLIVGNISAVKDTHPPYNMSLREIVLSHFTNKNIPVAFDFPGGHCDDNRAIVFGKRSTLKSLTSTGSLCI